MNYYYSKWKYAGPMMIIGFLLFTVAVMLLWNWLMPVLFGIHAITFWQALGLLVLSRLLFGWGRMPTRYPHEVRSKWETMTPEERKTFFQRHHHHYHWVDDRDATKEEQKNGSNE